MTLIASRRRGEILSAYRTRRTVSAEIRVVDKQQAAGSSGAGAGCSSAEMTHSVLLLLSATLLVSATAAAPAITVYSHPRCHYCQDVKAMLKDKAIRPCSSPWAAQVVLTRKPDGSWRFCTDYSRLGKVTRRGCYPP